MRYQAPPFTAALFAQLGLGVRDEPVPRDLTSDDDQAHVGLLAVIGPFTVTSFESALQHAWDVNTAGDRTEERGINPRLVLAQAWHPEKLQAARRQLAVAEPIHPIDVTGLRVPGLPELFTVTDGMHRTVAARLAGHHEIRATVCGHWHCELYGLSIEGRHIATRLGLPRSASRSDRHILRQLGVEDRTPPAGRLAAAGVDLLAHLVMFAPKPLRRMLSPLTDNGAVDPITFLDAGG